MRLSRESGSRAATGSFCKDVYDTALLDFFNNTESVELQL